MLKYLILGAGPAGVTMANCLKDQGEENFLVLEKEENAGGLCRSEEVGGFPLDFGGGHFLDARKSEGQEYILSFMPLEEWNYYPCIRKIDLGRAVIDYPMEAQIYQLPLEDQVEYLKSIAYAGANLNTPMPEKFEEWAHWKLGDKIAGEYLVPYNKKMFGRYFDELGTYWLDKLPTVNFEDTLLSCLERKMHGKYPSHGAFYYPKTAGYGEVWHRMSERVKDKIEYHVQAVKLDCQANTVNDTYKAEYIINTIPWTEFDEITGCDSQIAGYCKELPYTSLEVRYFAEDREDNAHWVFYPNHELPYHRRFYRNNFIEGGHGGFYETNMERVVPAEGWKYVNQYAYPCNTVKKKIMISAILQEMEKHHIFGVGRWGEWEHFNSDTVVNRVIALSKKLL